MTPEILDDWYWWLMCYWMILFRPFEYMKFTLQNKRSKKENEL